MDLVHVRNEHWPLFPEDLAWLLGWYFWSPWVMDNAPAGDRGFRIYAEYITDIAWWLVCVHRFDARSAVAALPSYHQAALAVVAAAAAPPPEPPRESIPSAHSTDDSHIAHGGGKTAPSRESIPSAQNPHDSHRAYGGRKTGNRLDDFYRRPVFGSAFGREAVTTGKAGDDRKGPWFLASYRGACSGCSGEITAGTRIRADGDGGWECWNCR